MWIGEGRAVENMSLGLLSRLFPILPKSVSQLVSCRGVAKDDPHRVARRGLAVSEGGILKGCGIEPCPSAVVGHAAPL